MGKTKPCVIISPDEMNKYLRTVIIAPLTHTLKLYPSRVICNIDGDKGAIMLDQMRNVDRTRIGAVLSKLHQKDIKEIKAVINKMLC